MKPCKLSNMLMPKVISKRRSKTLPLAREAAEPSTDDFLKSIAEAYQWAQ